MKNKIKEILESNIFPFNIISKSKDNYIVQINFNDEISGFSAKLTIDFDLHFENIKLLFSENGSTVRIKIAFHTLKDTLISKYNTSELSKWKLSDFIWDNIFKLCTELHNFNDKETYGISEDTKSSYEKCMEFLTIKE